MFSDQASGSHSSIIRSNPATPANGWSSVAPAGATLDHPLAGVAGFDRMIELWLPLAWSLNMVNRSMGHNDLYPFVLPPAVLNKMRLVHKLVVASDAAVEVNAAVV